MFTYKNKIRFRRILSVFLIAAQTKETACKSDTDSKKCSFYYWMVPDQFYDETFWYCQVTLNPETWHCYRGIQKFREMMDMEDDQEVNFGELVEKGDFIHIDDEVVHLGAGAGVTTSSFFPEV